jgi:hypothetical protein
MQTVKLFLNGFLSTLTIFLVFGTLYFFWATQSNSSELNLSIQNLIIYAYKSDPPGFAFGNGTLLLSLLGGLSNTILLKIQSYISQNKRKEVNTNE